MRSETPSFVRARLEAITGGELDPQDANLVGVQLGRQGSIAAEHVLKAQQQQLRISRLGAFAPVFEGLAVDDLGRHSAIEERE